MNKQKTPEEKLLKLIRKKTDSKSQSSNSEQIKQAPDSDKYHRGKRQRVKYYLLRNVNRVLMLVAFFLAGYCIVQLFTLLNRDDPAPLEISLSGRNVVAHTALAFKEKPIEVYLQEIEQHNLFQSPWVKPQEISSPVVSSSINNELKLMGIILDDDPKAIVKDLRSKQTLFLSEGEEVNGAFVEKISEGKVLFLQNGKHIELVK